MLRFILEDAAGGVMLFPVGEKGVLGVNTIQADSEQDGQE
jgi:hypothetical protein